MQVYASLCDSILYYLQERAPSLCRRTRGKCERRRKPVSIQPPLQLVESSQIWREQLKDLEREVISWP